MQFTSQRRLAAGHRDAAQRTGGGERRQQGGSAGGAESGMQAWLQPPGPVSIHAYDAVGVVTRRTHRTRPGQLRGWGRLRGRPGSAPRLLRAGGAHGQCWQGRHQRRQPVVCRRSQLSLSLGAGCGICVDNEANWPRLLRRLLLLLLLLLLGARRGRTPLPGIALAWPRHHVCNCRRLGMGRLHFSTASPNAGRRGAASVAAAPAN